MLSAFTILPIDALVLLLGAMCSLGLAAVALSVAAMFQASSSARVLDRRTKARHAELEAAIGAAHESVQGLVKQVDQIREQSPAIPARRGFNLSTRSQALRMHRRGDTASQIAAVLQVSVQEVELLLRVHRIVLDHLIVVPKAEPALARANQA